MTSTTQGEAALLERLVRRLGPYVKDGALRRTRLDRVLAGLALRDQETEALRGRVIAALAAAGIDLVDDRELPPAGAFRHGGAGATRAVSETPPAADVSPNA